MWKLITRWLVNYYISVKSSLSQANCWDCLLLFNKSNSRQFQTDILDLEQASQVMYRV